MNGELPSASGGLAPGSRIAGYLIEEQIGRGGMAVVYRASDPRLNRSVALKILPPELTATRRSGSGSCGRCGPRRPSTTRTSSRCLTRARRTGPCSSRCGTSAGRTASASYLADYLGRHHRGISLEHFRRDRILAEALATGADPLHLAVVFNIDHTTAMACAGAARNLLPGPAGQELSSHRPA